MKQLITLILTVSFYTIINCQSETFTIHVQTTKNASIPSAHLTVEGLSHHITDKNGNGTIHSNKSIINILITHVGYVKLDTTINIEHQKHHTISLIQNYYTIDPVTILDKQRLFEKSNWRITDITHHEYGFVVSASEKSNMYIYLFDKNGIQLLKSKTKFKHKSIDHGLKTGHYHLMNEKKGQEVLISTDTIIFMNIEPLEKYEKTLHHFIYSNANYTIAEEWAAHNKQFTLSVIDNKRYERKPFYTSFDEENYIRSQSVYKEIIGLYYRDSYKSNPYAIKDGSNDDNIITQGIWTGDLYDLVISDTIQEVYNYYISIYANEISVATQVKDDQLFVLDDLKRTMFIFPLGAEKVSTTAQEIPIPAAIEKGEFMSSGQEGKLFIISKENYYSYDIPSKSFTPIDFEIKEYYYPKNKFIDNNTLYTLAQQSRIKHKKWIYRSTEKNITE